MNIGDLVKAEQLHNGWDDEFECLVIDEDKVRPACGLGCACCLQQPPMAHCGGCPHRPCARLLSRPLQLPCSVHSMASRVVRLARWLELP